MPDGPGPCRSAGKRYRPAALAGLIHILFNIARPDLGKAAGKPFVVFDDPFAEFEYVQGVFRLFRSALHEQRINKKDKQRYVYLYTFSLAKMTSKIRILRVYHIISEQNSVYKSSTVGMGCDCIGVD